MEKRMNIFKNSKVIALSFTLAIILILLLTGPVQAFILGLTIDDTEIDRGEIITFMASVKVEANEILDIDNLTLKLLGPMNIQCVFDINGNIISGCPAISILKISSPTFGYGYGYGVGGEFKYNITINTKDYKPGRYSTFLEIISNGQTSSHQGEEIHIMATALGLEGCSIRADGGDLIAGICEEYIEYSEYNGYENSDYENGNHECYGSEEEMSFGEGHLSFYLPKGWAVNSQGSLTAQKNRDRISYTFKIIEVLGNTQNSANILVLGNYKINRGELMQEQATIFFDKLNNKASLLGNNIQINNMDITFRHNC